MLQSYLLLGEYQESIKWFDKTLQVDPQNTNVLAQKGEVLQFLGQYYESLEWVEKALQINPDFQLAKILKQKAQQQIGKQQSMFH